jgi:RNA recognition motif-containing protein
MISELNWWTTDDDIRGWLAQADTEPDVKELTFSEHKVNGKSKGQAYIEFASPGASTAAKRYLDQLNADGGQPSQKKISTAYWNPGMNPFRTLPKDAPARVKEQPRTAPSGPYNDRGNYGGGFRGRGGFNGGRGGMGQNNYNRNFANNNNMNFNNNMNGGGFNGPMGGMPQGGNFGYNNNRGGMMGGGMRGGPGGMRGGRGGNMMGMNHMMPMGMPGNMPMGMMGGGMPGTSYPLHSRE